MNNPCVEAIRIFDQAFDHFNQVLCSGTLKKPIINILSRGSRKCLGWHWKDKWRFQEEANAEITLVAEHLDRPMEALLETLLHEMVHLYNAQAGVSDCNAQQRHNKHFKKTAEEVFFLKVERHPTRAWALTSLTPKSEAIIQTWMEDNQIKPLNLVRLSPSLSNKKTDKTYMANISADAYFVLKDQASVSGLSMKEFLSNLILSSSENSSEKVA